MTERIDILEERVKDLEAKNSAAMDIAVHLSLSFADIRNDDMSPSPETNDFHHKEALRLARKFYDDYERRQAEEALREMRNERRRERRAALKGEKL